MWQPACDPRLLKAPAPGQPFRRQLRMYRPFDANDFIEHSRKCQPRPELVELQTWWWRESWASNLVRHCPARKLPLSITALRIAFDDDYGHWGQPVKELGFSQELMSGRGGDQFRWRAAKLVSLE